MAGFATQSDAILRIINERNDAALAALASVNDAIDTTRLSIENGIDELTANAINIDLSTMQFVVDRLSGVTISPVASPTMPTQGTVSIGDTEWARIQALAAAELARSGVTEEAVAASEATLRGLSVPSVISTGMVSLAQQRTQDRLSLAALQNAVEHAKAEREDVIRIAELDLKSFAENVRTMLESYKAQHATNEAYERLDLEYQKLLKDSIVDPERIRAEYDLKKTEMAMNNAVGQLVDLLQIDAQIATATLNAANVGMDTRTSIDNNYPYKYNPGSGDVVIYQDLENQESGGGI